QVKTGVRYYPSCRNVGEIGLENIREQMPNEYKDKLRIPGLVLGDIEPQCEKACQKKEGNAEDDKLLDQMDAMQKIFADSRDCSIIRRSQLPTNENSSTKDERMERKVSSYQEDKGSHNILEREDKIERSSMLQDGYSKTLLNDRCVRNRPGSDTGGSLESTGANLCVKDMEQNFESQFLKSKRNESCSDESETFYQDFSEGKISLLSNNQHSSRILSAEIITKRDDDTIIEESERIRNTIWNQNLNGTYSWNVELNNRQLDQDGNKQKPLTGSTCAAEYEPKASDLLNVKWLRKLNQQVMKKKLQLVTGQ
ncbi:MAG: hypothetical protein EZS28_032125, partial [Streblomastix strix]